MKLELEALSENASKDLEQQKNTQTSLKTLQETVVLTNSHDVYSSEPESEKLLDKNNSVKKTQSTLYKEKLHQYTNKIHQRDTNFKLPDVESTYHIKALNTAKILHSEYKKYLSVFDKIEASTLSLHQKYEFPVDLKYNEPHK
ncbi:hypothetical protein BB561_002518 [Smittium simulii]|uniref:Uncharacterized protein n=1 Tax=Smittium simulii TaxID=133385 RepID=A0A2T9YQ42_9FUNG|nr:hypothetical protein BB561_002518 [Smittium simulii]